jgi:hypothetical protein
MSPEIGVRYSGGLRGEIWGESDRPIISVPGPLMISLACRWACLPKHQPRHKFSPNPSFAYPAHPTENLHTRRTNLAPSSRDTATIDPRPSPVATRSSKDGARRAAGSFCSHDSAPEHVHASMEPRRRPEYNLEIFADLACVKDVVKGMSFRLLPCFDCGQFLYPHYPLPIRRDLCETVTDALQRYYTPFSSTDTSPPSRPSPATCST